MGIAAPSKANSRVGRLYSLVYKGEVKTWMILLLISLSFKWEGKGRSVSKRVEETFQVKIFYFAS